jgi:hypothetical protein
METPFDKIGPGQVGRLAYQVLGKNGPVFNPNNIRYLPPDAANNQIDGLAPSVLPTGDQSVVATGLAGINLLVSSGTLALSAATYNECRKILKEVNQIALDIQEVKSVLQDVQARVQRIDTGIAENNLRECMRRAFKEAFAPDGIDLTGLHCLTDDIANFSETLERPLIFNFGLRFASDVRKELKGLLTFLANLRLLLSFEHNIRIGGDPYLVVRFAPGEQYFSLPFQQTVNLAFHFGRTDRSFQHFVTNLREQIHGNFFFASEEDAANFGTLARDHCFQPIWTDRIFGYSTSESEALLNSVEPLEIDFSDEGKREVLENAATAWFYNSDASLLHRTFKELQGLKEGYETVFYSHLPAVENEQREAGRLFICGISDNENDGAASKKSAA